MPPIDREAGDEAGVEISTAFAAAVERREWALVSLHLVLGVCQAAARLPSESFAALVERLDGVPGPERRGG